jgi:TATA-binding protein-associated factor Taf7
MGADANTFSDVNFRKRFNLPRKPEIACDREWMKQMFQLHEMDADLAQARVDYYFFTDKYANEESYEDLNKKNVAELQKLKQKFLDIFTVRPKGALASCALWLKYKIAAAPDKDKKSAQGTKRSLEPQHFNSDKRLKTGAQEAKGGDDEDATEDEEEGEDEEDEGAAEDEEQGEDEKQGEEDEDAAEDEDEEDEDAASSYSPYDIDTIDIDENMKTLDSLFDTAASAFKDLKKALIGIHSQSTRNLGIMQALYDEKDKIYSELVTLRSTLGKLSSSS